MANSDCKDSFLDAALMQEGAELTRRKADAATLVHRRAVDQIEEDIFLEMLGLVEGEVKPPQTEHQRRKVSESRRQVSYEELVEIARDMKRRAS